MCTGPGVALLLILTKHTRPYRFNWSLSPLLLEIPKVISFQEHCRLPLPVGGREYSSALVPTGRLAGMCLPGEMLAGGCAFLGIVWVREEGCHCLRDKLASGCWDQCLARSSNRDLWVKTDGSLEQWPQQDLFLWFEPDSATCLDISEPKRVQMSIVFLHSIFK